ncbi:MAG: hypothetical protein U0U70_16795 [Chitinophagaceae bacterium]
MKQKLVIAAMATTVMVYLLSSCYKNREDIQELPKVSFRGEIMPIMTAGPCGCHNNGYPAGAPRVVQFSHIDTIWYDAVLSRVAIFKAWVNGGVHPGEGSVDFTPSQKLLIKRWIDEGGQDDGSGCNVSGRITYTVNIVPIYNATCKGSACHGGIATALDYAKLVAKKDNLVTMTNTAGAQGHPGGVISLSICTINTIKEWLAQGQPLN